jgi:hypothetical protein
MDMEKLREDPFAAILAARSALQASDKFVLKSVEGVYGGTVPSAGNQMLLEDEPAQGGPAPEIDGEQLRVEGVLGLGGCTKLDPLLASATVASSMGRAGVLIEEKLEKQHAVVSCSAEAEALLASMCLFCQAHSWCPARLIIMVGSVIMTQVVSCSAPMSCLAEAEALLASLDPQEREAVLAALAKKKRKAEKAARLEQAEVRL